MENFHTPSRVKQEENSSQKLLSIPPSPFLEKLGYGTGVNVWKLQPSPKGNSTQSPWAIKNVRNTVNKQLSSKYQSLLNKEAKILKALNHENIVGFRGYLKSDDGRKCLAMEIGGESLGNLIEARCEGDLGPFAATVILKVALSVAKALQYLHDEKRMIHGDLKSFNIVIKNDFEEIKLCDFGVSFSLDENNVAEKYIGTPIYSAPECQEGVEGQVTSKADIFSFGLLLWEMLALCPPHTEDFFCDESFFDSDLNESEFEPDDSLFAAMDEKFGTRPPLPPIELGPEYSPVIEIFYCCTEQNPDKRPTAAYLVKYLESLVNS